MTLSFVKKLHPLKRRSHLQALELIKKEVQGVQEIVLRDGIQLKSCTRAVMQEHSAVVKKQASRCSCRRQKGRAKQG